MHKIYAGNPFKKVPILDINMIFESSIKRSKQISKPKIKGDRIKVAKIWLLNRIETLRSYLVNKLEGYLKVFPKIDELHEFYKAIIQIYGDLDKTKINLGRINGSLKVLDKLTEKYKTYIRTTKKNPYLTEQEILRHLNDLWKQYIARTHSIVKKLDHPFRYLNALVKYLKKLPDYNPELPTVIVAGPPNTGKSSLVKKLSSARVEIASYPFTTKNLVFGHIKIDTTPPRTIQLVDSPGLFDRPISNRKREELIALEAIRTIATAIIFLFDGSQERTLTAEEQLNVFREVMAFIKTNKFLVAINKIDIRDPALINQIIEALKKTWRINPILISVKQNKGLDNILNFIKTIQY